MQVWWKYLKIAHVSILLIASMSFGFALLDSTAVHAAPTNESCLKYNGKADLTLAEAESDNELKECIASKFCAFNKDAGSEKGKITCAASGTVSEGDAGEKKETSCGLGPTGWVLCPALNFLAGLADGIHATLGYFLEVRIIGNDGTYSTIQRAWSITQNIANMIFLIVAIIIVYSQITSTGISNYGIKSILPRLLLGVILINFSLIITVALTDVSNLLGGSIYNMFKGVAAEVGTAGDVFSVVQQWTEIIRFLVAGIFAAAASLVFALSMLSVAIPLLLSTLFGLLTVLVILVLRQALVIILIVTSPIAFAMNILPNTEKIFKAWWNLFKIMLVVYPATSAALGLSLIASIIILEAAPEVNFSSVSAVTDAVVLGTLLKMAAYSMPLASMFIIYALLRSSQKVFDSIFSNGLVSGAKSMAMKKASGFADRKDSELDLRAMQSDSQLRFTPMGLRRGRSDKRQRETLTKQRLGRAQDDRMANVILNEGGQYNAQHQALMGNNMSDAERQRLGASAAGQQRKRYNEDVENATVIFENQNTPAADLQAVALNGEETQVRRQAAMTRLMQTGQHDEVMNVYNNSVGNAQSLGLLSRAASAAGSDKPTYFTHGLLADMTSGQVNPNQQTATDVMLNAIEGGKYNAQSMSTQMSGAEVNSVINTVSTELQAAQRNFDADNNEANQARLNRARQAVTTLKEQADIARTSEATRAIAGSKAREFTAIDNLSTSIQPPNANANENRGYL